MAQPPTLTQLRSIFVSLYPEISDAKRVADDTDINHGHITTEGSIVNIWHALIKEAEKQDRIASLLTVAAADYPHNQELAALIADHHHALLPLSDIRLLNFAHAFNTEKQVQVEKLLGKRIDPALGCHQEAHFDDGKPYGPQCAALAEQVGFSATEWQTLPILVNPPSFAPIALCLLAELHGRMRHFPAVLRLRPVLKDGARDFAVAEIINLQEIRDRARNRV